MNIKRCEHCRGVYSPERPGANAILCRKCLMDCEGAYPVVYRFLRQNSHATLEEIAAQTETPVAFVKGLILDGRFVGQVSGEASDYMEAQRKRQLMQLMGEQNSASASSNAAPAAKPATQRAGGGNKNYGLGR